MTSTLMELNPEQLEAVNTLEGPLLVIAGAGSGKTRVVTLRIIKLLEIGVPASSILGLTFTNKAAEEMRDRVRSSTKHQVLISTFHSLGMRILRESIHHLDYRNDFIIYDSDDSEKLMRTCLQELMISDASEKKQEIKNFREAISKAKNNLVAPDEIEIPGPGSDFIYKLLPSLFSLYQKKLKEYNALDFDDLLLLPVRLFKEHPEQLEYYQNRWKFLLIDEYQDTNAAQYTLVKLLASKYQNICVVGDPDQSIYSWRGANIRNILEFQYDYPNARMIRLEQNYRSQKNILGAANALIAKNSNRFEKELWSTIDAGEKIRLFVGNDQQEEADYVVSVLRKHRDESLSLNDMVIFYRTNAQSRLFEDVLLSARIPYKMIGGLSFYQRKEIKDVLAYLRVAQSDSDFISFARTINLPKRGLGDATIDKIRQLAFERSQPILLTCLDIVNNAIEELPFKLTERQLLGLRNYLEAIADIRRAVKELSLKQVVETAIVSTGYLEYLRDERETFQEREENLNALLAKAIEWESKCDDEPTLSCFLEELTLKTTVEESSSLEDSVTLMTLHNSKGLEFPVVILVGMEEDLLPHSNSRNSDDALEEERRLCYVGLTRAQRYLYLTSARTRYLWGMLKTQRQSRFLNEIPSEFIERVNLKGLIRPFKPTKSYIHALPHPMEEERSDFHEGDIVKHPTFGAGIIRKIGQGSLGLTYTISFVGENSDKQIVAKYGNLKLVERSKS